MEGEEDTAKRPNGEELPSKNENRSVEIEMTSTSQKEDPEVTNKENALEEEQSRCSATKEIIKCWSATILIGFFVVSFWRGTWTLLDNWDCDQANDASVIEGETFCFAADIGTIQRRDSGIFTYWISIILLAGGVVMIWAGLWRPKINKGTKPHVAKKRAVIRFLAIYIFGWAAVCMWRGIWYMIDYWILLDNALASWWTTTVAGLGGLYLICAGASALAPPAIFLLDGPSVDSPPVAVTLLSSFYDITLPADTLPPKLPRYVYAIDVIVSFFGVPILVVGFWRGCWGLMDHYLWDFSLETSDFDWSLVWSTIIAVGCLVLGSDDIVPLLPIKSKLAYRILGRVRTLVLAVGAVNWWRFIWYTWDEYMSTSSPLSAWLSHAIAVAGLTLMGCLSCIVAPPSTLGVDALAHPDCSDEPLFSNVPVPSEALFVCGIARQPLTLEKKDEDADVEELDDEKKTLGQQHLEELVDGTMKLIRYYDMQRQHPRPKIEDSPEKKVLSSRTLSKRKDKLCRSR